MEVQAAVTELERNLRQFANSERAAHEQRYLKSSLKHLGASVWEIRRVVKDFVNQHSDLKRVEVIDLVQNLWSSTLHERRMAAVMVLEMHEKQLIPEDLDVIEQLVRESRGWAFVDALAGDVAGHVALAHPSSWERIDQWARDSDFWLRRSALLACLAAHKAGEPLDRFFAYADSMLDESEFFIRKAIGWVLREAGKKRPDEVFDWLKPRMERISGVTIREAIKYLSPAQREKLLEAYRSKRGKARG